ncbi:MAG: CBS domain-containing protein [Planctomycetota bacterium]
MTRIVSSTSDPIGYAGRIMSRRRVHHLLVLDEFGRPTGILTSLDVLGEVFDRTVSQRQLASAV